MCGNNWLSSLVMVLLPFVKMGWCFKFGLKENQKKTCTVEEVIEDVKCISDDNEQKSVSCIFCLHVMIVLPGDTVHVGCFCVCRKVACPSKILGKSSSAEWLSPFQFMLLQTGTQWLETWKPVLLLLQIT